MAHTKVVSPAGWDWPVQVASILKLAGDGRFGPNDRREFVKRAGVAGAHIFGDKLATVKFAKDEIPVHLIALGSKEAWGPNRNGDAFTEATLKEAHDTFVKYAYWFKNHKNKKAEGHPHYGLVKASAYNPEMRRVELLCGLPATKEAAVLLGCDDVDTQAVEKLARNEDVAVSMACRVPYDVCSGCRNKARTRDEYCKAASCKYGGCYDNLTRLVKVGSDVHHLHVENPNAVFFDISDVFRPADRTAYAGRADWVKAAADGFFGVGGAKTAADLGLTAPAAVVIAQEVYLPGERSAAVAAQLKLAHGLDLLERRAEDGGEARRAFSADVQPPVDLAALGLDADRPEKVAAGLGALAARKVVLPLRDFARMTKRAGLAAAAADALPGVYGRLIAGGGLERRLAANPYAPAEKLAAAGQRAAAARLVASHALEKAAVENRCRLSAVRGCGLPPAKSAFAAEKVAADQAAAAELAADYACYKVAALHAISGFDPEFMLTARLSVCQNSVI